MLHYQVRVTSAGSEVAPLVKALRLVGGLGLGDANGLSDSLRDRIPCVLLAGVSREVADHAAGLLREAGAGVAVEESSLDAPVLLRPEAGQRYQWNWLAGPTPI